MIVFKEIILCQNVSKETNVSKMIVMQSTAQPFTNIWSQIKRIEVRKEERKIPNKIEISKGTLYKK